MFKGNLMEALPWLQKQYFLEDSTFGDLPEEYPPGSEGYKQFNYNPRTKESRNYAETFLPKPIPSRKKSKKKSYSKKKA